MNVRQSVARSAEVDGIDVSGVGDRGFRFAVDDLRRDAAGDEDGEEGEAPSDAMAVEIDLRPFSERNRLRLGSRGAVPVRTHSDVLFDGKEIDLPSLGLGPGDLLTDHRVEDVGLGMDDVEACPVGTTVTGQLFEGCDLVTPLPEREDGHRRHWRSAPRPAAGRTASPIANRSMRPRGARYSTAMRLAPVLGLVVPIVASSCLAASPALAEWTEWIAEADASFAFDSNLNNASIDAEEEWDLFWRPEARLGRVFQLEGSTRLHLLATLRGEIHHRWQNLDSIAGAGELALSHKFGLGDAPWARVFANGGYEGVQDGQRSGLRAEVGAQAGKRFSPRLDAAIAYRFLVRQGDDGRMVMVPTDTDVWDQEAHELGIEGRWLATGRLLVTAGYDFRSGDLYSNAQSDLPTLLFAAETHAAAQDLVFGGWAYRIEGHAHSPYLSLNWALGDHWSVDAGYRFRYAESRALDYTNHVARLTLLFRY